MTEYRLVWSDEDGDLRNKKVANSEIKVVAEDLYLELRRLTTGKGRAVIEIKGLPKGNKKWCQLFAKELKKLLGVGGTYKNDYIELHSENIEKLMAHLDTKKIKWKKTGG